MGLLSWFKGNTNTTATTDQSTSSHATAAKPATEVPGMNGAVQVARPEEELAVFDFGSVASTADKVTLAGFCPVSADLEPCRWEILPASTDDAPQFRIAF